MESFRTEVSKFWREVKDLHLGIAQKDNKELISVIEKLYGHVEVYSFPSGATLQGWEIAPNWTIEKAIFIDNQGAHHVLDDRFGVPYLMDSENFDIESENDSRLFTCQRNEVAVPWHCSSGYTPWKRSSGVCLSIRDKEAISFPINVEIVTRSTPGEMIIGEMSTDQTASASSIFLNAHTCHPGQFNDAIIGICTIASLIKLLRQRNLKYTYRGIFAPEHIGTVFYLNMLRKNYFSFDSGSNVAIYTEMTALNNPISLQESLLGNSIIDRLIKHLLTFKTHARIGPFRGVVGNDETVWESVGYEIPCVSISRVASRNYYRNYHTNLDSIETADLDSAYEVFNLLLQAIEILECDVIPKFTSIGLQCLSNPQFSLYVPWPEPTLDRDYGTQAQSKFAVIQDVLPRYMNGRFSCLELSMALNVEFRTIMEYLEKWKAVGLVTFTDVNDLRFYSTKKSQELERLGEICNQNVNTSSQ